MHDEEIRARRIIWDLYEPTTRDISFWMLDEPFQGPNFHAYMIVEDDLRFAALHMAEMDAFPPENEVYEEMYSGAHPDSVDYIYDVVYEVDPCVRLRISADLGEHPEP